MPTIRNNNKSKPQEIKKMTTGSTLVNEGTIKNPKLAASLMSDQAQEIPIFLRKTYHMVDTCDPTVACWSEDGETFVVKDPIKFEQKIIPQFFKHSKFSSFVRQLNFYAFRKIKYADTIRIDPKLEAETANYWRFRHENFQRGKPELLSEIKRMNGQKQQQQQSKKKQDDPKDKENVALKTEVTHLKSRIEAMNKNIDELTSLVKKVTLHQQTMDKVAQSSPRPSQISPSSTSTFINQNNKRTKVEDPMPPLPDIPHSHSIMMDVDPIPSPMRSAPERVASGSSEISDDTFVDQLFTAFKTESFEFDDSDISLMSPNSLSASNLKTNNRPRPELMARLSDALEALPRSIQELIVDRLIQAITEPKEIQENVGVAKSLEQTSVQQQPLAVPQSPKESSPVATNSTTNPNLPLAAATLAALLSQYGEEAVKVAVSNAAATSSKDNSQHNALLIPVHA